MSSHKNKCRRDWDSKEHRTEQISINETGEVKLNTKYTRLSFAAWKLVVVLQTQMQ